MSNELFVNDVSTTLAASATNVTTTLTIASATGLPAMVTGSVMRARIEPAVANGSFELVTVTARTTTTLTVARGQEGTTGTAWASGDRISFVLTAASMTALTYPVTDASPMTGLIGATVPRVTLGSQTIAIATTGRVRLAGRWFVAGRVIGNLAWASGSTAAVTPTHSYMALVDVNGVVLATTADNTTTALPAATAFTWPIATIASGAGTSYTIPIDGYYYLALSVSAATQPTAVGFGGASTVLASLTPYLAADGGISATPPTIGSTLTVATPFSAVPWLAAYV